MINKVYLGPSLIFPKEDDFEGYMPGDLIVGTTAEPNQTIKFYLNDTFILLESDSNNNIDYIPEKKMPVLTKLNGLVMPSGDPPEITSIKFGKKFNTDKVTSMSYIFGDCEKLKAIDLEVFNTDNVTDMSTMFIACLELEKVNISNFNTENVTNMSEMFSMCSSLQNLDL